MVRVREVRGKVPEECVHYWYIDKFNVGRCKNCPAVKDFDALMNKDKKVAEIRQPARQHGGKRGRKKKQATSKP